MNWRRLFILTRLKRFDRDVLVQLLLGEHRVGSIDWLRVRWWRWLMQSLSASDVFTLIYAKNIWGSAESRSGSGSTLDETENLRQNLPALLRQYRITSLLDIPCGDFHWMSTVDLGGVAYSGADIVAELVAATEQKYGQSGRQFLRLDLLTDALPSADAILCRDCLVHLPNHLVFQALDNICSSGATYLLATTFPAQTGNPDINLGYWRPLNLQRAPFHLPEPLVLLHEGNPDQQYADKSLALWRVADLQAARATR